jgi:hypothetical protein
LSGGRIYLPTGGFAGEARIADTDERAVRQNLYRLGSAGGWGNVQRVSQRRQAVQHFRPESVLDPALRETLIANTTAATNIPPGSAGTSANPPKPRTSYRFALSSLP